MSHNPIMPADVDKRYRWAIVEYAKEMAEMPATLVRELEQLLEADTLAQPLSGLFEARAVLGEDLPSVLQRSNNISGALANFIPGFAQWLGYTGWGSDARLIRLFDRWAQEVDRRKRQAGGQGLILTHDTPTHGQA